MDLRNEQDIEKLNDCLTKIVEREYGEQDGLFACIHEITISYICDIDTSCLIHFGKNLGPNNKSNWEKTVEIPLVSDNLDFIAGQFFQVLFDQEL